MAGPPSGRLAQLVEHLVYTERVGGSSPSAPTMASLAPEQAEQPEDDQSPRDGREKRAGAAEPVGEEKEQALTPWSAVSP